MKTAYLFSGQGAQYVGMGADLYNEPIVRSTFDEASRILGYDMAKLCFEENDLLSLTQYTQPAILTVSTALLRLLNERGGKADAVMGLSLGEYSALVAAEALPFEEAIQLVAKRGQLMAEAVPPGVGKMVAVMNTPVEVIERCCEEASAMGIVSLANYNTPAQIVIGGEISAVDQAMSLLEKEGAKRMIPLNVSGPFHTELLAPASEAFGKELNHYTFQLPQLPIISNTTANVMEVAEIPVLLERQMKSPVRFYDSIDTLKKMGIERVIEIGPGKVLSGFVKKIDRSLMIERVENKETLASTITNVSLGR